MARAKKAAKPKSEPVEQPLEPASAEEMIDAGVPELQAEQASNDVDDEVELTATSEALSPLDDTVDGSVEVNDAVDSGAAPDAPDLAPALAPTNAPLSLSEDEPVSGGAAPSSAFGPDVGEDDIAAELPHAQPFDNAANGGAAPGIGVEEVLEQPLESEETVH